MIFEIHPKDFWYKVEDLYDSKDLHVKDMDDQHIKLGLKYKNTIYHKEFEIVFQFEVIDKEKFFLAKLKYGI